MDDLTTYTLLVASFFFVALSFALLARYRQASRKINESTDMGRDLWSSLEQRLKKQDERILDVMARLEVVQARVLAAASAPTAVAQPETVILPSSATSEPSSGATQPGPHTQQQESHESQQSQASTGVEKGGAKLDETQLTAMKLLATNPQNTRELTDALKKSREHTARIMKELFEMGLVSRNDASKPFVYQLTEDGKRAIGPAPS